MNFDDWKQPSNIIIPTVTESNGNMMRSYDLFSRLMVDRIVFVTGPIEPNMASIIVGQLLFLEHENEGKPIYLYINSPGGHITAGLAIIDTMNFINSPVHTICIGMAASMGAWILAAGEKGTRSALPNSEIMIHQPLGGTRGQATDIQIQADQMAAVKKRMVKMFSDMTGHPEAKIVEDIERDNYMYADAAKEYGLIDEVHTSKADLEKSLAQD